MKNHINISKIRYHLRDNMRNDNESIKKTDKKIDKIINEKISLWLFDTITNYVLNKHYTDLHNNLITIKLSSEIVNNYYEFIIDINNKHININDKYAILEDINNNFALIEYKPEYESMVINTFYKLSA